MIQFNCTGCGVLLKLKDEMAGKKGKCPKCSGIVRVPPGSQGAPSAGAGQSGTTPAGQRPTSRPAGESTRHEVENVLFIPPGEKRANFAITGPITISPSSIVIRGKQRTTLPRPLLVVIMLGAVFLIFAVAALVTHYTGSFLIGTVVLVGVLVAMGVIGKVTEKEIFVRVDPRRARGAYDSASYAASVEFENGRWLSFASKDAPGPLAQAMASAFGDRLERS